MLYDGNAQCDQISDDSLMEYVFFLLQTLCNVVEDNDEQ